MKIGVVSDTHLRESNDYLKRVAEKFFSDAAMILHAGDLVSVRVLDAFGDKDIRAVRGNMDGDESLPEKLVIEIEGVRIGLVHGWGFPWGLEERLISQFERIDCLVYGHTHSARNHVRGQPRVSDGREICYPQHGGLLEIKNGKISGRIEEINRKDFM